MENNQKEQTYYHGSESIKRQVAFRIRRSSDEPVLGHRQFLSDVLPDRRGNGADGCRINSVPGSSCV